MDNNSLFIASMAKSHGRNYTFPAGTGMLADMDGNYRLFFGDVEPVGGEKRLAVGCDWTDTSTGKHYHNTGTAESAVWSEVSYVTEG